MKYTAVFITISIMILILSKSLFLGNFDETKYISPKLQFDLSPAKFSSGELWSDPKDPYLTRLRVEYKLDELVKDAKNDYEKIKIVTHWVSNFWKHDGNNHPTVADPIAILERVKEGNRYACVEYSIVLAGCLNALGIPSRKLSLKMSDVETHGLGAGHVVTEAYVKELGKWVMLDGQLDAIPVLNDTPLNAVEFQNALAEGKEGLWIDSLEKDGRCHPNQSEYLEWIAPYLYYFDFPLDHRYVDNPSNQKLMLVPIGAKEPKIFQRTNPIKDMSYTSSLWLFYQKPVKFELFTMQPEE